MRWGSLGGERRHRSSALIEFDSTTGRRRQGKTFCCSHSRSERGPFFCSPSPRPHAPNSTPLPSSVHPATEAGGRHSPPRETCPWMETRTYCCKLHRGPAEKLFNFIQFRHTITPSMSVCTSLPACLPACVAAVRLCVQVCVSPPENIMESASESVPLCVRQPPSLPASSPPPRMRQTPHLMQMTVI